MIEAFSGTNSFLDQIPTSCQIIDETKRQKSRQWSNSVGQQNKLVIFEFKLKKFIKNFRAKI